MKKTPLLASLIFALVATGCVSTKIENETRAKDAAAKVLDSSVFVKIKFKLHNGEKPLANFRGKRCPNCGSYHGSGIENFIKEESSAFLTGFVISPDHVLCEEIILAPENLDTITVCIGEFSSVAKIEKAYVSHGATLLKLEKPFDGKPGLAPDAEAGKPALSVKVSPDGKAPLEKLSATLAPVPEKTRWTQDGKGVCDIDGARVLLDAENRVCGYVFDGELGDDVAILPDAWQSLTVAEIEMIRKDLEARVAESVVPVTVNFRSPKKSRTGMEEDRYRYSSRSDTANATEINTVGVLMSDTRMMIYFGGDVKNISRLESIKVTFPGATEPASATFVHMMKNMAVMIADLDAPRPDNVLKKFDAPLKANIGDPAFTVHVTSSGKGSVRIRTLCGRVRGYSPGWRDLPVVDDNSYSEEPTPKFVFSADKACMWMNIPIVENADSIGEDSYRWRSYSDLIFLPIDVVEKFATPEEKDVNLAAKPVPPEAEGTAVGWLGFDMQPINRALAEMKKVLVETENGSFGAIVNHVYPGSPAAEAGVEDGWILLNITLAGRDVPIKVKPEEEYGRYDSDFPWDEIDRIPARYFERYLSAPWGSIENKFVKQLTEFGVGTKLTAEFLADGKKVKKEMTIAAAPSHYGNAPSFKWDAAGISVCDLTFDVRDYLKLDDTAPGVVVCKIETGTPAVIAGVRPFEIITQINGTNVFTAKEFESAVANIDGEVRLNMTRMINNRVVSFTPKSKDEVAKDKADSGTTGIVIEEYADDEF